MYKVKRFSLIQKEFGNKENKMLKRSWENKNLTLPEGWNPESKSAKRVIQNPNEGWNYLKQRAQNTIKTDLASGEITRDDLVHNTYDDARGAVQKFRKNNASIWTQGNYDVAGNTVNDRINSRANGGVTDRYSYTDAQRAEARRRIAERKAKEAAEKAKSSIPNPVTPTPKPSVPTTPSPTTPKPKVGKFKLGKGGKIALGTAAAAAAIYGTKKAYDMTVGKRKNN